MRPSLPFHTTCVWLWCLWKRSCWSLRSNNRIKAESWVLSLGWGICGWGRQGLWMWLRWVVFYQIGGQWSQESGGGRRCRRFCGWWGFGLNCSMNLVVSLWNARQDWDRRGTVKRWCGRWHGGSGSLWSGDRAEIRAHGGRRDTVAGRGRNPREGGHKGGTVLRRCHALFSFSEDESCVCQAALVSSQWFTWRENLWVV